MTIAPPAGVEWPQAHHWIGSRLVAEGVEAIDIVSPWDGRRLGVLRTAGPEEVAEAVREAQAAAEAWAATPVKERVQPLYRFKAILEKQLDDVAALVSAENGKTLAEARAGIEKGIEVVEFACGAPALLEGGCLEVSAGVDCHSRHLPLGVVAGITPFNFPAMVPMWMFPLALAAGNAFILKPSEQVPLTPLRLAECLREAGLPDGVFQVVQGGRATAEAILDAPGIAAVAFVGSTAAARAVYRRGTEAGKRMLALGGAKNHLVVVPDADPELTARNVAASATGCAGQRCMAASVLVAVGACDPILDRIEAEMRRIRPGCEMGAIISRAARDRIVGYIGRAEKEGARVRVDGRGTAVPDRPGGFFVGATMLDEVPPGTACATDEIFGPVLAVVRVSTLDEALAIQQTSAYGNAASIYTRSGDVARYFEMRVNAGMIGVNIGVPVPREPFSFGGWNHSLFGHGDITGRAGLAFWSKTKKVTAKWTADAARNWMT